MNIRFLNLALICVVTYRWREYIYLYINCDKRSVNYWSEQRRFLWIAIAFYLTLLWNVVKFRLVLFCLSSSSFAYPTFMFYSQFPRVLSLQGLTTETHVNTRSFIKCKASPTCTNSVADIIVFFHFKYWIYHMTTRSIGNKTGP